MRLESFIVSTTPAALVRNRWGKNQAWLEGPHILFPDDDAQVHRASVRDPRRPGRG